MESNEGMIKQPEKGVQGDGTGWVIGKEMKKEKRRG